MCILAMLVKGFLMEASRFCFWEYKLLVDAVARQL